MKTIKYFDGITMAKAHIKKLCVLSVNMLAALSCFGQGEINNWYFGNNAAMTFNSGVPVALSGSALVSYEGSSSISDSAGNLLFYTNGINVWNKFNIQMPNGYGLFGHTDATQTATIIKKPGSNNLYYIFTIDYAAQPHGICYSIVDMNLSSGNGDVASKNNLVYAPATEKLAATYHSNGTDIWIVTHEWNTNNFRSYLLTSSGLSATPVTSGVGLIHTGVTVNTNGYMSISPAGNKLAVAICHVMNRFELFDFDNSTGVVSNAITMNQFPNSIGAYGIEFSPDGSKLYGSCIDAPTILQWDLNAGNPTAIINSQQVVATNVAWYGAMKIGPDCKIYIACSDYYVGVINYPDSLGLACNVVNQAVYLGGNSCGIGLPNFLSGATCSIKSAVPIVAISSSDTNFCEKQCIDFFDLSTNNPTSWQWSFTGATPQTSTLQNPVSICYNTYGSFPVTLIVCNQFGCDSITMLSFINEFQNPIDSIYQSNDTLYSMPSVYYQWYEITLGAISGAINQYYVPSQTGNYYCVVKDSIGCESTSNIIVVTALESFTNQNGFEIIPNPSDGHFEFAFTPNKTAHHSILLVTNILGEIVFEKTFEKTSGKILQQMDMSSEPKGVYFVKMIDKNSMTVRKFIID